MFYRLSQDSYHYQGRQIHATVLPDPHNRVAKYAIFHLNLDIIDLQTGIFLSINYIFDNDELNGNIWNIIGDQGCQIHLTGLPNMRFFT